MSGGASRGGARWALVGLLMLTLLAYLPALSAGFTNWDDDGYVTENAAVQRMDVRALLFEPFEGNHHPVTMLSLAANHRWSDLDASSYHPAIARGARRARHVGGLRAAPDAHGVRGVGVWPQGPALRAVLPARTARLTAARRSPAREHAARDGRARCAVDALEAGCGRAAARAPAHRLAAPSRGARTSSVGEGARLPRRARGRSRDFARAAGRGCDQCGEFRCVRAHTAARLLRLDDVRRVLRRTARSSSVLPVACEHGRLARCVSRHRSPRWHCSSSRSPSTVAGSVWRSSRWAFSC